jgi:hypothetical protein
MLPLSSCVPPRGAMTANSWLRRWLLDQMISWSEAHLRRVLKEYTSYYNAHGPISTCRKTPHIAGPLSAAAASSPATSWADFTINTVGFSFRKGHPWLSSRQHTKSPKPNVMATATSGLRLTASSA